MVIWEEDDARRDAQKGAFSSYIACRTNYICFCCFPHNLQNQRALNKAMRDLDRERMKMDQQEKKVIADIKKLAKDNQMDAVKIMAKDLVRTRRQSRKFMLMKANIQVDLNTTKSEQMVIILFDSRRCR